MSSNSACEKSTLQLTFYSYSTLACLAEIAVARGQTIEQVAHSFVCDGIDRLIEDGQCSAGKGATC